jgi:hypothetical protein
MGWTRNQKLDLKVDGREGEEKDIERLPKQSRPTRARAGEDL